MPYRTGSTSALTVGSQVQWTAGRAQRTGTVLHAIHAGRGSAQAALQLIQREIARGKATSSVVATNDRRELSYVVQCVDARTGQVSLHWPRTGALRPAPPANFDAGRAALKSA